MADHKAYHITNVNIAEYITSATGKSLTALYLDSTLFLASVLILSFTSNDNYIPYIYLIG